MDVVRIAAPVCMALVALAFGLEPARGNTCAAASALGVSRTVDIDTMGGPRFGAQYPGHDFLQPGEIVLTFDDGPSPHKTPAILNALAAHCTKATFFIVGRMALADPDLLREVASQGHTIGLHTQSHRKLTHIPAAKATEEIELGHSIVVKSLGQQATPFFRFPYLAASHSTLDYLGKRNIATFGIDVDSKDFQTKKPEVMAANVLKGLQAKGKGIILFHDIQPSTAAGLKALLDELKKRNFKVVHVVSKTPATTIPSFDQQAERMIARGKVASARKLIEKPPEILGPDSPPEGTEELPWLRDVQPPPAAPPSSPPGSFKKKQWWEF